MDENLKTIEAELGRLQPAAPSRALYARVAHELAEVPAAASRRAEPRPVWFWALSAPLAAAAALAVMFTRVPTEGRAPSARAEMLRAAAEDSPTALRPVAAENVLYAASDEGLVTLEDGTPARRERLRYVDTITWRNPRTNASLTWSVPREEVRVVPVLFQ